MLHFFVLVCINIRHVILLRQTSRYCHRQVKVVIAMYDCKCFYTFLLKKSYNSWKNIVLKSQPGFFFGPFIKCKNINVCHYTQQSPVVPGVRCCPVIVWTGVIFFFLISRQHQLIRTSTPASSLIGSRPGVRHCDQSYSVVQGSFIFQC